jgi:IS5 family transposase
MKQQSFATVKGFEKEPRPTRKEAFLSRMETLVPWGEFCALIDPNSPKAGNGRPPIERERMLRMYGVANWFNLGDEVCEEVRYDTAVFREFCGIDLGEGRVPDATTRLNFRHLMEKHELGAALLAKVVGELLQANGRRFSGGTIVDATLIEAPCSTQNREKARDPEMHSTKKGNPWHFGMKVHIGADSRTGSVHHASVTAAHIPDSHEVPNLLLGDEPRFYGDSAYRGRAPRERLKTRAPKAKDFTNRRAYRNQAVERDRHSHPPTPVPSAAKVEHPFLTLKRLWSFAKVRYRGLAKNAHRAFAMLALHNLVKWGKPLTGERRPA